ncbi:MAG: DUF4139 domain-containing protein [Anaerolineae bacterium]|nr:DUF4139 domain-containing protein [Anaerolineae bacterium]
MRRILSVLVVCLVMAGVLFTPVLAQEKISYISQPDDVYIFLNNIAFARDAITLPASVDVQVFLPQQIYLSTLVVRENDERVPSYRIRQQDGQTILEWSHSGAGDTLREITLEYLLGGLSWTPRYDMWLGEDAAETVDMDFFAEIQNSALDLNDVTAHLIAGRVDTAQQVNTFAATTTNQYIAGYQQGQSAPDGEVGAATIQHIYEPGTLTAAVGDLVYVQLAHNTLPARRVLLWNAQNDQQASVIYKVRNDSSLPFTEGIVRSYQHGIFIGSDGIEITPIGSEGSVTVGKLQDVRVNRSESTTAIQELFYDTLHQIELTISNFGTDAITLEVVDIQDYYGEQFVFSTEPARDTGNLLRWTVTVAPGETVTINYEYKTR